VAYTTSIRTSTLQNPEVQQKASACPPTFTKLEVS